MPKCLAISGSVHELAERLERDIRSRGLTPGHRYLTGPESAELLGTSLATANRALQRLAAQNVVVRRRSSGTFVGSAVAYGNVTKINSICILTRATQKLFPTFPLEPLVQGLLEHMDDVAEVRLCYVPDTGSLDLVRPWVESVRAYGNLVGVVAISLPYDAYRFLGESGAPLVVMGSLYPGQTYPSIDTNEHQAGYLLTRYLLEHGHRRLAMFSNSESCPGDHYFQDGASEALTEAQLLHNALVMRAPGPHEEVFRGQVQELLTMPDRPTGFIVRVPQWAELVAAMAQEQGLEVPRDLEIVFKGFDHAGAEPSEFPSVQLKMPFTQRAELVGRMLAQSRQRVPLAENNVVVPYELKEPIRRCQ